MKAEYKIAREILLHISTNEEFDIGPLDSEEEIDVAYGNEEIADVIQDATREFRCNYDQEIEIECDWSRHYDSKSVAKQLSDGSWVGWTYWYGGGKHGEPEAIDWIGDSYNLEVIGEKTIVIREFKKLD